MIKLKVLRETMKNFADMFISVKFLKYLFFTLELFFLISYDISK